MSHFGWEQENGVGQCRNWTRLEKETSGSLPWSRRHFRETTRRREIRPKQVKAEADLEAELIDGTTLGMGLLWRSAVWLKIRTVVWQLECGTSEPRKQELQTAVVVRTKILEVIRKKSWAAVRMVSQVAVRKRAGQLKLMGAMLSSGCILRN